MRILVFGGTGLIGKALLSHSEMRKNELWVVSRTVPDQRVEGNLQYVGYDVRVLRGLFTGSYGVINFTGAGIGNRLWFRKRKRVILDSRIKVAGMISDLANAAEDKPAFILQASAVGFYGNRGEEDLDEDASVGIGFLPEVTQQWEQSIRLNRPEMTRSIFLRTGLVLSRKGGFLGRLLIPFRWYAGGHFGNGLQWMPWIHMDDEVNAILYLMNHGSAGGPFNLVATNPQRMKDFCMQLGNAIDRPSWMHAPAFVVRMLPGGFGDELLLTSQKVRPEKLIRLGYTFKYTNLGEALFNIFGNE